jgi:hypothetical protein
MKQSKYLGLALGLVLLAVRCQPVVSALTASQPLVIDCHITSHSTTSIEGQTEAATVSLSLDDENEMVAFESFEFHAQFDDEPVDGRVLTISILNPESGDPLLKQVYLLQRATHPQNQFRQGHGFTGLSHTYTHDASREITFFCEAR